MKMNRAEMNCRSEVVNERHADGSLSPSSLLLRPTTGDNDGSQWASDRRKRRATARTRRVRVDRQTERLRSAPDVDPSSGRCSSMAGGQDESLCSPLPAASAYQEAQTWQQQQRRYRSKRPPPPPKPSALLCVCVAYFFFFLILFSTVGEKEEVEDVLHRQLSSRLRILYSTVDKAQARFGQAIYLISFFIASDLLVRLGLIRNFVLLRLSHRRHCVALILCVFMLQHSERITYCLDARSAV